MVLELFTPLAQGEVPRRSLPYLTCRQHTTFIEAFSMCARTHFKEAKTKQREEKSNEKTSDAYQSGRGYVSVRLDVLNGRAASSCWLKAHVDRLFMLM